MILKSLVTGFVIVLVFGLLVFAQRMPSGATLRGRFVYEDNGLPLRRAWVGLKAIKMLNDPESDANVAANKSSFSDSGYSSNVNMAGEEGELVLTGDNGEYVLKGVRPGIYFPFVKQAGIFNPDESDAENPGFRQITVFGNEETNLDIAVKRGGSIEGRVTYRDGSPALGIRVSYKQDIGKYENEYDNDFVKTDDRGVYRFSGLGAGNYYLFASEPVVHTNQSEALWESDIEQNSISSILKVYYPGGYSVKNAAPVVVNLGQEHPNIDIVIPNHPLATLSGVVVSGKDKSPIPDYLVGFSIKDNDAERFDPNGRRDVRTDENGRWSFRDLLPGSYSVTASSEENLRLPVLPREKQDRVSTKYASLSKDIEVVEGANDDVVFELPIAASISGTIEYEGKLEPEESYSYLFIRADDTEKDINASTFVYGQPTDEEKIEFVLDDMQAGSFTLDVSTFNGTYVRSILFNGEEMQDSKFKISEGESIVGVHIILATDFGTLEGRVTNIIIPREVFAYLVPVDFSEGYRGAIAIDDIKTDGTFRLKAKPGLYYLVLREFEGIAEGATLEEYATAWKKWVKGAEKVELKAGQTIEKSIAIN